MVRQFVDIDAAIRKHTAISVNETYLRVGGYNTLEPLGSMSCGHAGHSRLAGLDFLLRDRARRDAGCNVRLYLKLSELSKDPSVMPPVIRQHRIEYWMRDFKGVLPLFCCRLKG